MKNSENEITETLWAVPRCATCGSERVAKSAWVYWNPKFSLWEVETINDQEFCLNCNGPTSFNWYQPEPPASQRIRELNDRFRREGFGRGSILLTPGIQELGGEFASAAVAAVRCFNAFTDDKDPWGEHDFGTIDLEGERLFFTIDYYDLSLTNGSEDPANEGCTNRVMTIMLASEY